MNDELECLLKAINKADIYDLEHWDQFFIGYESLVPIIQAAFAYRKASKEEMTGND